MFVSSDDDCTHAGIECEHPCYCTCKDCRNAAYQEEESAGLE